MTKTVKKELAVAKAAAVTTRTKTTLEIEGLKLAAFVQRYFKYTQNKRVYLKPTNTVAKTIQRFLDKNMGLSDRNELKGIVAIRDTFKNSTGGRVHLIVGVAGPLGEAFDKRVLPNPIDYELKSKLFLKAISSVTGLKVPKSGNIHLHVMNCIGKKIQAKDLIAFLQEEHGYQNDILQMAEFKIYYLDSTEGNAFWKSATPSIIKSIFS